MRRFLRAVARHDAVFPIPMRGNEEMERADTSRDVMVSDPHEG